MQLQTNNTKKLTNMADTCVFSQNKNVDKNIIALKRESTQEVINVCYDRFVIGKDPSQTDYCISGNTAISRAHAIIIKENGKIYVVDKNSKNGTYVNKSRIRAYEREEINVGCKIRFANELFTVLPTR